jgi:hypothetical protein
LLWAAELNPFIQHPVMLQQIAFFILFAFRVVYQPGDKTPAPQITHFHAREWRDQLMLEWTVEANEAAGQFEVERSQDGKEFSTLALVFGSDKPETDVYRFKERDPRPARYYRIRLIGKDKTVVYSPVLQTAKAAVTGGHAACAAP